MIEIPSSKDIKRCYQMLLSVYHLASSWTASVHHCIDWWQQVTSRITSVIGITSPLGRSSVLSEVTMDQ